MSKNKRLLLLLGIWIGLSILVALVGSGNLIIPESVANKFVSFSYNAVIIVPLIGIFLLPFVLIGLGVFRLNKKETLNSTTDTKSKKWASLLVVLGILFLLYLSL